MEQDPLSALWHSFKSLPFPPDQLELLQLLRDVQSHYGYVPAHWQAEICRYLGQRPSYLQAIFRRFPAIKGEPSRYDLQVCTGPRCMGKGSFQLLRELEQRLGIHEGQTTADGTFSLRRRTCSRSCGQGPNLYLNGERLPQMDRHKLSRLMDQLQAPKHPPNS